MLSSGEPIKRPFMVESVDAPSGIDLQNPTVWDATRASLDYIRDTAQISRGDGDLLDPLIFTAILDANMTPVNRDPKLRVLYGGDISAPDELRRPVSINAVAQSLRLPFETVRRRINGLAVTGHCVVEGRGVIVPHAAVTSPAYGAIQRGRYDRARLFYQQLKAIGALSADGVANANAPTAQPLIRAANRTLSGYMLRASNDLIALTGDALSSLILLQLTLDNTADLTAAELAAWAGDPPSLAQAIRIAALAKTLRLSPETARRHVMRLESRGFCQRLNHGLVALAPPAVWPDLARLMAANLINIQRLFAALRELDILAAWDTPDTAWPTAVVA